VASSHFRPHSVCWDITEKTHSEGLVTVLEPLQLGPEDEEVYRALLAAPGSPTGPLARAAGCSVAHARAALARLADMRLVQRRPGRPVTFVPAPPDVAIASLVNELQSNLDQARLAIPDLLVQYQRGRASAEPGGLVEVLTGPQIGHRRFLEIQSTATEELLILDKPTDNPIGVDFGGEAPMLRRGVRCRGIYESSLLEVPGRLRYLRRLASLGEQARVAPRLPMRMVICDRRLAMLPLAPPTATGSAGGESVALVNPSSLLDALIELFEDYWQRSHPMWSRRGGGAQGLSPAEHEMLQLLGTGLKDEAIARQLGVSMRTARRRISALLTRLDSSSRFQAGAEAARRGLV
jgi:DNA-binding CsgD family transcriptional regulator